MEQAYANSLTPIYCVGENLEEREAGRHFDVVKAPDRGGRIQPYGRAVRRSGHRLRARMGYRHGQDRYGRAGTGDPRIYPRGIALEVRRCCRRVPDPLRRFVQALERTGDLRQGRRRRRSYRRRSSQSRGLPRYRQGLLIPLDHIFDARPRLCSRASYFVLPPETEPSSGVRQNRAAGVSQPARYNISRPLQAAPTTYKYRSATLFDASCRPYSHRMFRHTCYPY